MPKLPSEFDMGGLPSAESGRPIARADVSAVAEGANALGKGVQSLGLGMLAADRQNERLEVARAKADFLTRKIDLDSQYKSDPNYPDMPDRYAADLSKVRDQSSALIKSPRAQQIFQYTVKPTFERGVVAARDQAFDTEKSLTVDDVTTKLDTVRQAALKTEDPAEKTQFIQTGNDMITGLQDKGFINPLQARKMRQTWAQQYVVSNIEQRIDTEPQGVVNELRLAPGSPQQIDNRIIKIESGGNPNAYNPASDATGLGQFTRKTWLSTVKQAHPELASLPEDQLLALRRDPKLSAEMVGVLREQNWQTLQDNGIEPTAGNAYLTHFLGAGDALKVLRADPGTPVSRILSPNVIASNPKILGGKTAGSVTRWADGLMGGVGNDGGHVYDILKPEQREILLQKAQTRIMRNQAASDSATAQENYRVKSLVDDDITSMATTGVGVGTAAPEVIRNTLGDEAFGQWQDKRAFAHATWAATHDLASLPKDEINKRLDSLTPKDGQEGFATAQKIFQVTAKRAQEVFDQRESDPAGSVDGDPSVAKAQEAAAKTPNDPNAAKSVIEARLAAQTRAQIPQDAQSPISKDEALALTAPLSRTLPGQERDALKQIAETAKQKYGEYAQDALGYALRQQKMDKETGLIAARMVRKMSQGGVPDQQDARAIDTSKDIAAADSAVTGARGPQPDDSMGTSYDPSQGREAAPPVPPARAITLLREKPSLASDFDKEYGPGSAEKILKQYSIRPKQPTTPVAEAN